VAEWATKSSKKDCELCAKLGSSTSFSKGAKVRIAEAFDCANCPVVKGQPIPDNENIIELYNALPDNYDPMTGRRIITATDIKILFDLYEVPKEIRLDYYSRIMYFYQQMIKASTKEREKLEETKKQNEEWRKKTLSQSQFRRSELGK